MFKPNCKCITCKHLEDGIYFQRNECYKRVEMDIAHAIDIANDMNNLKLFAWLNDLYKKIHTFEKSYNKR